MRHSSIRSTFVAAVLVTASLLTLFGTARSVTAEASAGASGGVLLDGWGGLHPFGGATLDTALAPYWPGFDIARSLVVLPNGSGGYELDGWGGIHAFGLATIDTARAPYWPGWDIARSLVVLPGGAGGYELDGWGGVHAFGNAPALLGYPYWPGWDIARGLAIHMSASGVPDGGWELDGWGGIHAFGSAPALPSPHYFTGFDVWRQIHVVSGGAYVVGRWGIVDAVGSPAGIDYTGMPAWGSWDIVRDVVPVNPQGSFAREPISSGAASALMDSLQSFDRQTRGTGPLGEDGLLDSIAGDGTGYNLVWCGGPNLGIGGRSADMLARNYFAHAIAGCAGTQYVFSTYFASALVPWRYAGENIAWYSGLPSLTDDAWQINTMWLNSPEHYANIMSGNYSRVGCGVAETDSGSYQGANSYVFVWTCDFAG